MIAEKRQKWDDALTIEIDDMRFASDLCQGSDLLSPLTGFSCSGFGRRHAFNIVESVSFEAARTSAMIHTDAHMPTVADINQEAEWTLQSGLMDKFHDPHWRDQAYADEIKNGHL